MIGMNADGKTAKPKETVKETKGKAETKADEKPAEAKPAEGNQSKPAK